MSLFRLVGREVDSRYDDVHANANNDDDVDEV